MTECEKMVIFDVDGLVAYPGFFDQVLIPTQEQATARFWTFNTNISLALHYAKHNDPRFSQYGPKRVFGREDNDLLYKAIEEAEYALIAPVLKRLELTSLSTKLFLQISMMI